MLPQFLVAFGGSLILVLAFAFAAYYPSRDGVAPLAKAPSLHFSFASSIKGPESAPIDAVLESEARDYAAPEPAAVTEVGSAVQETAPVSSSASVDEAATTEVEPAKAPPLSAAAAVTTQVPETTVAAPVAPPAALSPAQRWAAAGIDLVTQGQGWDDQSFANVDAALSALPSRLLASLGNPALGQMHILVNAQGRALSGSQPYGGPANFYSTNDGVNELVLYPRQSASTVLHELGHAYNLRRTPAGRYALVLLDPEMQSFMAAAGWHVLSTDAQVRAAVDQMGVAFSYDGGFRWSNLSHNDPLEDFANSFAMFFLDPQGLRSLSQARYDWFSANVGR